MPKLSRSITLAAGALASGLIATTASAQAMQDRYWFEVAAFLPDVDTSISVSGRNGLVGTDIDLESDLDLKDRKTLPSFFAGARFGERWSLIGEYYALNRSGSAGVTRDIVFDDVTYPTGRNVSSEFNTNVYRAGVGYAFIKRDNAELGAVLGLHVTQFEVELEGEAFVGNAAIQSQVRKRDALAPLPTVGLYGAYHFTPKFMVGGRADYLSLKVGDYDGSLVNLEARATYRVLDHVGIGVMYRYVDYDLGINKDRWIGDLAYTYKGPAFFLQAGF